MIERNMRIFKELVCFGRILGNVKWELLLQGIVIRLWSLLIFKGLSSRKKFDFK